MLKVFTVSFFGHRKINNSFVLERRLEAIIKKLLKNKEYVEFLVGRNGAFDQLVSSVVRRVKRNYRDDNSSLVLVLPYSTAEYKNNEDSFKQYYDEVEICESSSCVYFKSAIEIRNREMVDRSELCIFFVETKHGGAYQALRYAKQKNKKIENLSENF